MPPVSDQWGIEHREKIKHEKQVSESPPASKEEYSLLLQDFVSLLWGYLQFSFAFLAGGLLVVCRELCHSYCCP